MNPEVVIQEMLDLISRLEKAGQSKLAILGALAIVSQAIAGTVVKIKAEPANKILPINAPLPPHLRD